MRTYSSSLLIILALASAIVMTACGETAPAPTDPPPPAPTDPPPEASPTIAPPTETPIPKPTATPELEILYEDDFSDPNSGWESYRAFDGVLDYEDGAYRLHADAAYQTFWVFYTGNYADLVLEAEARYLDGPQSNSYGVLCRYSSNPLAFYAFLINVQGQAQIALWSDGSLAILQSASFEPRDFNVEPDFLRAACIRDQLSLAVNGELLIELEDASLAQGDFGMLISNGAEGATTAQIEHLTLRLPE